MSLLTTLCCKSTNTVLFISGGKAQSLHSNKGQAKLQEASDQEEGDRSVRALLRTYQMKRPIVLIIDDRYALFPYDLSTKPDCTYVVLGFYHIAHAWGECIVLCHETYCQHPGSRAPARRQSRRLRGSI